MQEAKGNQCYIALTGCIMVPLKDFKIAGLSRDLNPGPPAPKAGIMPLDH